ncbi:MAG: arginine repressor [Firmicutes bacterium]|nr:arginine repressor [Bacillota bacterium]
MKSSRQRKILEIVAEHEVETQEELMELLHNLGHRVTQATISRDMKELRLVKVPNSRGGAKYAIQANVTRGDLIRRARRIFEDYVCSIDFSGPLIMLRTYPGGANAVAAVIDELDWPEMIGSIAGDDSILILTHSEYPKIAKPTGSTAVLFNRLQELMKE